MSVVGSLSCLDRTEYDIGVESVDENINLTVSDSLVWAAAHFYLEETDPNQHRRAASSRCFTSFSMNLCLTFPPLYCSRMLF